MVGNGRELVEAHLKDVDPDVKTAVQEQQLGTGDAVRAGLTAVPADFDGSVIVTSGDVPLLEAETLHELIAEHDKQRQRGHGADRPGAGPDRLRADHRG